MNTGITIDEITIRTDLKPGDLGYVIHRHGKMYNDENSYGVSFEAYVAGGFSEFYKSYDPSKDRVWICEHKGNIIGFILIMHRDNNAAQLRYFYLEPTYRGIGLGKKLMVLFMDFFKKAGYTSCYLWTTEEHREAAALYLKHGFKLTEEKESTAFGKSLKEQRYDMIIPKQ